MSHRFKSPIFLLLISICICTKQVTGYYTYDYDTIQMGYVTLPNSVMDDILFKIDNIRSVHSDSWSESIME